MQVPPVYITYRQAHLPVGLGNNYPIKSQTVVFPSNQAETQSLARCSEADQLPMLKAKLETFHSAVHECTPRASSAEALQLPTGVQAGFLRLEMTAGCHSLACGCGSPQLSSEGWTSPMQLIGGQTHLEQRLQEMLHLPLFVDSSVAQVMLKELPSFR